MTLPTDEPLPVIPVTPSPPPAPKKGLTVLAWLVILTAVALIVGVRHLPLPASASPQQEKVADRLSLVVMELQARLLVGGASVQPGEAEQLYEQAARLNDGSVEQRLRFAILAGELKGPQEALNALRKLDQQAKESGLSVSADERRLAQTLQSLYSTYAKGKLTPPRRVNATSLTKQLGWFGQLALHPRGQESPERQEVLESAQWTFLLVIGAGTTALVLAVLGLIGLILFIVAAAMGKLRAGLVCGQLRYGGVYAETFALWLLAYFGLSLLGSLFLANTLLLIRSGGAFLLSLFALAWPVVRGIPWRQVQEDIGWTGGRANPVLEIGAGVLCYVINLPLVVLGLVATWGLLVLQSQAAGAAGEDLSPGHLPAHPIFQYLLSSRWEDLLQIFVLASLFAPLVEETMFRGVLYRHVRELTCGLGRAGGFVVSTLLVCFLFAAVHPQGLAAIPLLLSLAIGFCIAREWRGTLLPAIFAHGLSNACVLLLFTSAMR